MVIKLLNGLEVVFILYLSLGDVCACQCEIAKDGSEELVKVLWVFCNVLQHLQSFDLEFHICCCNLHELSHLGVVN